MDITQRQDPELYSDDDGGLFEDAVHQPGSGEGKARKQVILPVPRNLGSSASTTFNLIFKKIALYQQLSLEMYCTYRLAYYYDHDYNCFSLRIE